MKSQPGLFQMLQMEIEREKKLLKRKTLFLKIRVLLCIVLPVVIVILAVKVIKTYLKIKLKNAVVPGLKKSSSAKAVKKESVPTETVVPEVVGEHYESIEIVPDEENL